MYNYCEFWFRCEVGLEMWSHFHGIPWSVSASWQHGGKKTPLCFLVLVKHTQTCQSKMGQLSEISKWGNFQKSFCNDNIYKAGWNCGNVLTLSRSEAWLWMKQLLESPSEWVRVGRSEHTNWEFSVKLSIDDIMHARVHSTYLELCTTIWILWERHRVLTAIWTFFAKTVALMYFCMNAERVGRTWQVIADLPVVWTWSTCAKPNLCIDWRNRTQMYKVGRCFKWYK